MSLQFKFFSIPLLDFSDVEEELNTFLRTVHVVTVHRELVCQEGRHYWAMALEYMTKPEKMVTEGRKKEPAKQKVDYKEVLSPEDFAVYAKLRDWRKRFWEHTLRDDRDWGVSWFCWALMDEVSFLFDIFPNWGRDTWHSMTANSLNHPPLCHSGRPTKCQGV